MNRSFNFNQFTIICICVFSFLVLETNGNEEQTSTLLSSITNEDIPNASKENINETIPTIIPEEKLHPIEQSTPNPSEEQKETISITSSSSSGLNPEATPFIVEPTNGNIEFHRSISTGDESDSNATTATSSKRAIRFLWQYIRVLIV